jgi:hypothetical protein
MLINKYGNNMINNFVIKLIIKLNVMRFPLVKEWGWVVFILSFCLFARVQASSFRQSQKGMLVQKIEELRSTCSQKKMLLQTTHSKLSSMSDPEMIKMLLMENLGLIKEGQIKVIFEDPESL